LKKENYAGNFVSQVPFGLGASVFVNLESVLFNKGRCRKQRIRKSENRSKNSWTHFYNYYLLLLLLREKKQHSWIYFNLGGL